MFVSLSLIMNLNSVILVIPDGAGSTILEAARMIEYGDQRDLNLKQFDVLRTISTQTVDFHLTDSAAAGTAIATGTKTLKGQLGIDIDKNIVENICEFIRKTYGDAYKIGIIAKVNPGDATPAAFQVHVPDRYNTAEVFDNMVLNTKADLVLGASHNDLVKRIDKFKQAGFATFDHSDWLANPDIIRETQLPMFGIVSSTGDTQLYIDQQDGQLENPSLLEMTEVAIEKLSNSFSNPFFLMVEASRIDDQLHDRATLQAIGETIEYDHLLGYLMEIVDQHQDIHLLTNADHETGGVIIPDDVKLLSKMPIVNQSESISEKNAQRRARIAKFDTKQGVSAHTNAFVLFGGYGKLFRENKLDAKISHTKDVHRLMKDILTYQEQSVYVLTSQALWAGVVGLVAVFILVAVLSVVICRKNKGGYQVI